MNHFWKYNSSTTIKPHKILSLTQNRSNKAVCELCPVPISVRKNCNEMFLRRKWLYLCLLLASLVSFQVAHAQKAIMTLDTNQYLIGDWINVQIDVEITSGQKITWPDFGENLGDLEILNIEPISDISENNFRQNLQLIAFDTGFFPIPAIKFYLTQEGNEIDSLVTDAALVEILAVPLDTLPNDIKPIKDVLPAKFTWKEALPWLIGLLVAILLILGLYYYYQKRKSQDKQDIIKVEPKIPAHEWALRQLALLDQKQLWQKDEVKAYYSELTDILRGYIERRWKTPAMESTTEEIKDALSRIDLSSDSRAKIGEVLFLADLVKFAKSKPLASEHSRCAELVEEFIVQTKEKMVANDG